MGYGKKFKAYPDELMTAQEIADELGLSRQRFFKLRETYGLEPWLERKAFTLFHKRDIEEFLKRRLEDNPWLDENGDFVGYST